MNWLPYPEQQITTPQTDCPNDPKCEGNPACCKSCKEFHSYTVTIPVSKKVLDDCMDQQGYAITHDILATHDAAVLNSDKS